MYFTPCMAESQFGYFKNGAAPRARSGFLG